MAPTHPGPALSSTKPISIIESVPAWKALRPSLQGTLGLVPTMGALHEGHLSLVRRAHAENDLVVVWIFVNPKQFGDQADFSIYPRDLGQDVALLETCGADIVLAPRLEEVYPEGFQTYVNVEELTQPLEGIHRPGHFRGVATVVAKMLCLTRCDRAYFGQKDAQQTLVVQRMVRDLDMLLEIVVCPTVREPDGLAMSSRNVHLNPDQRRASAVLYRALQGAEAALRQGERNGEKLREGMRAILATEPLAEIEYVSVADPATLAECDTVTGPVLASLAVNFGTTRLIDNLVLD